MMKINGHQPGKRQTASEALKECACALRFPIFLNTVTAILTGTLGIVTADTLGNFADAVFERNISLGFQNVMILAICIIAVVMIAPGLGLLSDFFMLKDALRHDNIVYGHYLDKDPEKAMAFDRGEIQYQLEDAPNDLRIYLVNILSKILSFPFCLGYLLYCSGRISWILTGFMFLLTVIKLVTPLFFKEPSAKFDRQEKEYLAVRNGYEADVITAPHMIKLWGIKNSVLNRMGKLFQNYYEETAARKISCTVFFEQTKEFMNHFTQILLLLSGAIMVALGTVSPGELAAMLVYFTVSQTLLNDIVDIIQKYPFMINAANRVGEFYDSPEIISGHSVKHFSNIKGENLSFAYPDKVVFENLNFSICRGDKIAVCGENGHGKSTLIKIICGLLKSYNGNLKTGDEDFKSFNIEDWRKRIAFAPQVPFLFSTTVRENVMMSNADIDKATADALMDEFGIPDLADRYIDSDSKLSGGEKQKISVIRALLKEPEVLILDEPSNHLDQNSIHILKKYISQTSKTVILISHDPSLSDIVDRSIQV